MGITKQCMKNPAAVAVFVADGMSVVVTGNGVVKDSPIRAVIPIADEATRTFEVRVSIPADIWVIGGAVKVTLPSGAPREVVAVPRDALILRSNSTYVFKINSDEVAERANVRTGAASGKFIEVLGAVKAGDKVVVRGGERLKEGQKVSAEAIS